MFILNSSAETLIGYDPHLFNIFVNDIPTPNNCELAMFADDTALICEVPWRHACRTNKILCEALEEISNFFNEWKIRLNNKKTEFIVFTESPLMIRKLQSIPPIINGQTFCWKDCVTYLGMTLFRPKAYFQKTYRNLSSQSTSVNIQNPILHPQKKQPSASFH